MATLGSAYVQIVPSAKGISSDIQKELEGNGGVGKAGKGAGESFGKKMVKTVAGLGIGAAIGKGIQTAFSQGAELEQNLGGTEAVFGEFASSIQTTAQQAYAQMGLSASDYMATANKMGSLFQGSGVEQQRSLDLTSKAMQRAADVASVMGIDTSMAMESIAGAAKGNFTMMDNLGVAMNATTLEAYALEKGVNFKWNTASNAEKAELAMQMFFDRTSQYAGNFERESKETFSGSFGAMKAAAEDFFGTLTTGGDVTGKLTQLLESAATFIGGNLLPMLGTALSGLPEAIGNVLTTYGPQVGTKFVEFLQNALNNAPAAITGIGDKIMSFLEGGKGGDMASKGAEILGKLANGFMTALPQIMTSLGNVVTRIVGFVGEHMPEFLQKGAEILTNIGNGIAQHLPEIATTALQIVSKIGSTIGEHLPEILQKGMELLGQLIAGIINAIPQLPGAIMNAINTIRNVFGQTDWKTIGLNILKGIANGLKNMGSTVGTAVKNVVTKIKEKFNFDSLISKVKGAFEKVKDKIVTPVEKAWDLVKKAVDKLKKAFNFSWKLPDLKLPHISVSGGEAPFGIGGKGSLPHFSIAWYKKAENNPYLFSNATLFGAGERNDEILYGHGSLMRDITAAVNDSNNGGITFYITVDGAENPEDYARRLVRELKLQTRTA